MQVFSLTASLLVITFLFAVYAEHDVTSFSSEIIDDERVWLVEFYSTMCGSCKEFSTVWSQVESSMRSIVTAQVNIDFPEGMEIAKKLKVLEEGVPNVKLLNRKHVEGGTTIMSGDSMTYADIMSKIKTEISGHVRREDGYFTKR